MNKFLDRVIPKWYHEEMLTLTITFMPTGNYLAELCHFRHGVLMRCAGTDCEFAVEKCIKDYEARYNPKTRSKGKP